jgi:methionine-rich copper-binding protein CopC
MKRSSTALASFGLLFALGAGDAFAHAFLDRAIPAVGGSVAASPSEVRLFFTEAVVAQFSGAQLTAASGAPVATGALTQDAADRSSLVLPIAQALPPGAYTVKWHAVSVDTHRSQGTFSFSVGR